LGIDGRKNGITQAIYTIHVNTSGFQIGPTPPGDQFQVQNNINFVDTLSWVRVRMTSVSWRIHSRQVDKKFARPFKGDLFNKGGGYTDANLRRDRFVRFGGGAVYSHLTRHKHLRPLCTGTDGR